MKSALSAALLAVLLISPQPLNAAIAPDAGEPCGPELLLRDVVENQGRRADHPDGFTRNRSLFEYLQSFPPELEARIAALNGSSVILEAGAGEAIAAEQLLQGNLPLEDLPTVIALSRKIERDIPAAAYRGKLRLLTGRFFEDVPVADLGRPDLILDAIGVISYTAELSRVLRTYLEILRPDGHIYLFLDASVREEGDRAWTFANRNRTLIRNENGNTIDLSDWLLSLDGRGIEVRSLENSRRLWFEKNGRVLYEDQRFHSLRIRKTSGEIRIPDLELISVIAERNPPRRLFRVSSSPAKTQVTNPDTQ